MVDLTTSHYSTGTASVAAGGTVVTGQGTAWTGAVRPGDLFGTHVGLPIRILSVNSNVSLTLAHPWPGAAQASAAYEIQRTPYDVGYRQAIEDLVTGISEGNLPLLSALAGAADKLPYFDSSDSMALADFPAWARSMLSQQGAADKIPYLTGANGAALTTLTSFARGLLGVASESSFRNMIGADVEYGSNVSGEYFRFSGGLAVAFGSGSQTLATPCPMGSWTDFISQGLPISTTRRDIHVRARMVHTGGSASIAADVYHNLNSPSVSFKVRNVANLFSSNPTTGGDAGSVDYSYMMIGTWI